MNWLHKIKRNKTFFYASNFINSLLPNYLYRRKLNYWLSKKSNYSKKTIQERLAYYAQFSKQQTSPVSSKIIDIKKPVKGNVYYFDLIKTTRYFKPTYKIDYAFGDITENQKFPTIVKSRPVQNNGNSVLLKLNSIRHYKFIKDPIPFSKKKNEAVWRGRVHKENRRLLVDKFKNHPLCNIEEIFSPRKRPHDWNVNYMSIEDQLQYKYILSVEGVDVATNLKWILSSNSLCFMPTPKFETWFMEGKLIPNHHYVHINDDYSNLIEKVNYYMSHENEALIILKNAKSWVAQFQNKKQERILSLLVLEKYFKNTGQSS